MHSLYVYKTSKNANPLKVPALALFASLDTELSHRSSFSSPVKDAKTQEQSDSFTKLLNRCASSPSEHFFLAVRVRVYL